MDNTLIIALLMMLTVIPLCVLILINFRKWDKIQFNDQREWTFMDRWNHAVEAEDTDRMAELLIDHMNTCPVRNSYCGDELFCPECPHGGLAVTSAKKNM